MTTNPITQAFDRLDDFVAVQTAEHGGITVEAVDLLQQAVGIEVGQRAEIRSRATSLGAETAAGAVLLGVLVGLLAADAR